MSIQPHDAQLCVPDDGINPLTTDIHAVHVLLTKVHHGQLYWHRAGYVTDQDGVTPVPLILPWWLSLLETRGLVERIGFLRGDKLIVSTVAGIALLNRLDAELFGGGGL